MKKLIAMVICTVLVFALVGCSNSKDGEANFNKDTGTPYAILEDGMVVVLIDNEWIEFKAK